jgi:multidrug transporter EmrE-like cation transporter
MKYILLILSIITLSAGQLLLKKGVNEVSLQPNFQSILRSLFNPYIFLGYVTYGISSILGLFLLKKMPISIAFPAMSLTYVIILMVSVLYFKEEFTIYKLFGIVLIVSGVSLLFVKAH